MRRAHLRASDVPRPIGAVVTAESLNGHRPSTAYAREPWEDGPPDANDDVRALAPQVDIPPMALHAEAAVLSHALWNPDAARELAAGLTLDHFFSEAHRRIFEALQTLVRAERPTHTPFVLDELTRTGRIEQVGRDYLAETIRWHVEKVPIDRTVAHLDDLLRRRQFIDACREFAAHGHLRKESTAELLDRAQAAVLALAEGAARRGLPVLAGASLAEPLPELPWLVPALGIAPGAPVLVAGYGYSRKTLAAQSLLLSVASGQPALA